MEIQERSPTEDRYLTMFNPTHWPRDELPTADNVNQMRFYVQDGACLTDKNVNSYWLLLILK